MIYKTRRKHPNGDQADLY